MILTPPKPTSSFQPNANRLYKNINTSTMKSKSMKWLGTLLGCLSLVTLVSVIAGPVNEKCPLSGNAVKKDATYSVGFCCGNCQGKFTENPGASISNCLLYTSDAADE